MESPQIGIAFLAGLLSFFSPCVMAVAPGYLGMLTGSISGETVRRREALQATILFVFGFTIVFGLLGTAFSALGQFFRSNQPLMLRMMGFVVILFGLQTLGLLKMSFLFREKRFSIGKIQQGPWKPFLIGAAFAFGWTPCVGPILGTILAMASTSRSATAGFGLLGVYSLGMALPFLVMAIAFTSFQRFTRFMLKYSEGVQRFAGVILIIMGLLIFFDKLSVLSIQLNRLFNGWTPENWLMP